MLTLLLEAVVSCAGVTFNLVATAMAIRFTSVKVIAEADGDIRGALGGAKDVPVGGTSIRLAFEIDSPASDEQLAMLLKQTERYCVVYQTLCNPPRISTAVQRLAGT